MRSRGIECPVCGGITARVAFVQPDPDNLEGSRAYRVAECGTCELRYPTVETLAPPDAWDRLRELRRDHMRDLRADRRRRAVQIPLAPRGRRGVSSGA